MGLEGLEDRASSKMWGGVFLAYEIGRWNVCSIAWGRKKDICWKERVEALFLFFFFLWLLTSIVAPPHDRMMSACTLLGTSFAPTTATWVCILKCLHFIAPHKLFSYIGVSSCMVFNYGQCFLSVHLASDDVYSSTNTSLFHVSCERLQFRRVYFYVCLEFLKYNLTHVICTTVIIASNLCQSTC